MNRNDLEPWRPPLRLRIREKLHRLKLRLRLPVSRTVHDREIAILKLQLAAERLRRTR